MRFLLFLTLFPAFVFAQTRVANEVTLQVDGKEIHFAYSLPDPLPEGGAACVVVLDGLATGKEALKLVGDPGAYAVIAFEYPPLVRKMWTFSTLLRPYATRQAIVGVPQDVLDVVRWTGKQPWCDGEPVSLIALSFGATFAPAIFHLAKDEGILLGPSVLAFGGADIKALFEANLPPNGIPRTPFATLFSWILYPLEPARHTPYMEGEFLIIYGTKDQKVPLQTARELADLIPEPKTVIELDVGHLEPEEPEPLGQTLVISKRWLDQTRSAKPPPN